MWEQSGFEGCELGVIIEHWVRVLESTTEYFVIYRHGAVARDGYNV